MVTVAKRALAALGVAMIAAGAALTIAFGTGQQARADNVYGGAGSTMTQSRAPMTWSAAPTTLGISSAAPTMTAQPFEGGEGSHH